MWKIIVHILKNTEILLDQVVIIINNLKELIELLKNED